MALISKASLLMVPSTYEEGTLYNVLPSGNRAPDSTDQNSGYDQTRADFTFDRGSNAAATRVNSDGLIEKYRENLLVQSNQFDTTWTTLSASVTSGQSGYDGSNDAWLLSKSAANGRVQQSKSGTGVYTFSVYAKAGEDNWCTLIADFVSGTDVIVWFDLQNGVVGTEAGSPIESKITSVGSDWYKISIAFNCPASLQTLRIYVADGDNSNGGTSGSIYIQNAQLESGMVSTDYLDSGATTAKAGVLIDLPRINYDANGENGSLLLEPQRANLLLYSEYIDGWLNAGGTSSQNSQDSKSPEGVYNAAVLDASSVRYRSFSISSSAHSYSVYAKAKSGSILGLRIDTPVTKTTNFDLSDGTIQSTGSGHTASIEDAGNGWYRCVVSFTDSIVNAVLQTTSSGSVYVWGAQLEAGSYPTSLIPNHGESGGVTRAADSCSVTGVSDVIGQTEGTIYAEFEIDNLSESGNEKVLFYMKDTGTGERYLSFVNNGSLTYIESNGAVIANISKTGLSVGSYKAAIAYKANDFAFYLNGEQVGTDNTGTPSGFSTFGFQYYNSAVSGKQFAKQTAVFKERLSNAELAALTA